MPLSKLARPPHGTAPFQTGSCRGKFSSFFCIPYELHHLASASPRKQPMLCRRALRRLSTSSPRNLPKSSHLAHLRRISTQQQQQQQQQPIPDLLFPDDDNAPPSAVRHIHLTAPSEPLGLPTYAAASSFQSSLRQAFLDWKKSSPTTTRPSCRAPSPLVLSFTPTPTYTLGKRQKSLAEPQLARLRQPLFIPLDEDGGGGGGGSHLRQYTPAVVETDRGGLTTYHGPGQLVLWPIIDLHSAHHPPQTVRSYARLLEETTQAVLAALDVPTYLSEQDPGVWSTAARARDGSRERKIAAVGVHLRRHVTGLGTALNLDVVVDGDDEAVNPWARFVPCGLEGKTATSVRAEVGPTRWAEAGKQKKTEWYARRWVAEFASRLGVTAAEGTVYRSL